MKNFILLFTLFAAFCFGQQTSLKEKSDRYPLYIIDGMISNETQMKLISSKEIAAISVYKSDSLPDKLSAFSNFALEGIIDITLKEKNDVVAVSLEHLNIKNNLNDINSVYVNGILVKDTTVKIVDDAIIETEIIENNGQKFLNIWTVTEDQRKGITKRTGGIKLNPDAQKTLKHVVLK